MPPGDICRVIGAITTRLARLSLLKTNGRKSGATDRPRLARRSVWMAPMPDEAPVTSAKAAVAVFDAVLIAPLLSVVFASHHVEGCLPAFSTVLAFFFVLPAARH